MFVSENVKVLSCEERLCSSGLNQSGEKRQMSKVYKAVSRSLRSNSSWFVWWRGFWRPGSTVSSRRKCCCSSDVGLTVLRADGSGRINGFKMEVWRGVGLLRVSLWLWIREIKCFTQLFSKYQFLTHAGEWSSLSHPKKGIPWVRTFDTSYFVWTPAPSRAKQKLLTCASDGVFYCDCHRPLWRWATADTVLETWLVPSAARASKTASSGDVSGTVLSSYSRQLTGVTFDWIHGKHTHPKCDKACHFVLRT